MITHKRLLFLFACLTFVLLVACEPLAPEQTPRYIVVTGETPDAGVPTPTFLLVGRRVIAGTGRNERSASCRDGEHAGSSDACAPPVTPTEASFVC